MEVFHDDFACPPAHAEPAAFGCFARAAIRRLTDVPSPGACTVDFDLFRQSLSLDESPQGGFGRG